MSGRQQGELRNQSLYYFLLVIIGWFHAEANGVVTICAFWRRTGENLLDL